MDILVKPIPVYDEVSEIPEKAIFSIRYKSVFIHEGIVDIPDIFLKYMTPYIDVPSELTKNFNLNFFERPSPSLLVLRSENEMELIPYLNYIAYMNEAFEKTYSLVHPHFYAYSLSERQIASNNWEIIQKYITPTKALTRHWS